MSDPGPVIGVWRLTLAAVEPGNCATFDIRAGVMGDTEPRVYSDEVGMSFVYPDGRRTVYFAANLLSAEYIPTAKATA